MKELQSFLLLDFPAMLKKLNMDAERKFGSMNPIEMLDHLRKGFILSHSRKKVKIIAPPEHVAKAQAFLASDKQFRPGAKMPEVYHEIEDQQEELNEMKLRVLQEMVAMLSDFDKNPDLMQAHPNFGELNVEQWLMLHRKHVSHHMRQFSLID